MTREENIFVAKRMLVDTIYNSAKLEGLAVTYAQTLDIIENLPTDVKPSEVNDIVNLKNGWKFILENLDSDLDLALIKNCHSFIGRGLEISLNEIGEFRTSGVAIGGTTWRPRTPNAERLHTELMNIKQIENVQDRAIFLFCWIMRNQMFRDGNKRVASLVANFELVRHGAGIISVPERFITEFKLKLVNFYESADIEKIKSFIEYKCLFEDTEFLSKFDKEQHTEDELEL